MKWNEIRLNLEIHFIFISLKHIIEKAVNKFYFISLGQYTVVQDDCRTRIVDYFVDEYKKFHADVKYEGEICPGYYEGLKAKHAHHAPAPYHAPTPAP